MNSNMIQLFSESCRKENGLNRILKLIGNMRVREKIANYIVDSLTVSLCLA